MMKDAAQRRWGSTVAILALISGTAVAVIYLPQTLLINLAQSFGVTPAVAGITATTIQIGYAVGIFLLVPLADRVQPRIQVAVQTLALVAAILVSVVLPSIGAVALGFAVAGLVANVAQVILPAANRLAPSGRAGSTTATLIGSWLAGIFGGRIVAGVLVDAIGWRGVLILFAVLLLILLPFAHQALRADERVPFAGGSYIRLLGSTVTLIFRSPTVGQSVALQLLVFTTFNSFWTVAALYLTGPAVGWTALGAGLFGFVGLAVVLFVPAVGRLITRFGQIPIAGAGLLLALIASLSLVVDHEIVPLYAVSMFLIALSQQVTQSAVQSRLLASNPSAPGQANTVFMFFMFIGGALGAFLGPWGYAHGGLTQVAIQSAGLICVSLLVWLAIVLRASRRASQRGTNG